MKHTLLLLLVILLFWGCTNHTKENKDSVKSVESTEALPPGLTERDLIKATGRQVLTLLKSKNFTELVKYFSNNGVLFAPYGNIDVKNAVKLTPDEFIEAVNKNDLMNWGSYDGTGDPIKLTIKDYLKKFVYNADFLNSEAVAYDEIIKQGNSLNNLKNVFPDQHFIDYHFSGFDQKNNGMDWASLRLVFEKSEGQYFVVAIIHDQWTI